ncbi:MAG TPA: SPOR domain-containing protein [Blastocatellia bacterium]|nr:SPOR domain-containing protein [Blastocatellia bacterium]
MSNKNVVAVFVIGLALLLGAFWAGLYAVKRDSVPRPAVSASDGPAPAPPAPVPAQVPPQQEAQPEASPNARFVVQVGGFGTAEKANELVAQLKKQRYLAAYLQEPTRNDRLYRVLIGTYNAREDAQQVANELANQGFKGVQVIPLQ